MEQRFPIKYVPVFVNILFNHKIKRMCVVSKVYVINEYLDKSNIKSEKFYTVLFPYLPKLKRDNSKDIDSNFNSVVANVKNVYNTYNDAAYQRQVNNRLFKSNITMEEKEVFKLCEREILSLADNMTVATNLKHLDAKDIIRSYPNIKDFTKGTIKFGDISLDDLKDYLNKIKASKEETTLKLKNNGGKK